MKKIAPIKYDNQLILTTQQLSEEYGTDTRRISENYNANKKRYVEGKHYYLLQGDSLKEFLRYGNCGLQNESKIRSLYLWTEQGALYHAKSLNIDEAWAKYDILVETYFRAKEFIKQQKQNPNWQQARLQSKNIRLHETAEIKRYVAYCEEHGSKNAQLYYTILTNLVNNAVGISSKQRDNITSEVLLTISILENTIRGTVAEEIQIKTDYHEIYYICKDKVKAMIKFMYLPEQKLLSVSA